MINRPVVLNEEEFALIEELRARKREEADLEKKRSLCKHTDVKWDGRYGLHAVVECNLCGQLLIR